jgi:hypothetical protein
VRRAAAALLAAAIGATPAVAQDGLRGTWRGGYVCAQGPTALALSLEPRKDGTVAALFHFEAAPDNPEVPTGCFEMQGRINPATGELALAPQRWLLRPGGYVMVGLVGQVTPEGVYAGRVRGPGCTEFRVERVSAEVAAEACRAGAPLLSLR